MIWKKAIICTAWLHCFFGVTYAAETDVVFVQRGETLSQIAERHIGKPVYRTRAGALKRLLELNPQLKNPNLIFPGDEIRLVEPSRQIASDLPLQATAVPEPVILPETEKLPEPAAEAAVPAFKRGNSLEAATTFYFSQLNGIMPANATKATIASQVNMKVSLAWQQHWSEELETSANLSVRKEKYGRYSASSALVSNPEKTLADFGVGAKWRWSPKFSAAAAIGFSQELYYRGLSSGPGVEMDSVALPNGSVTLSSKIAEAAPFYAEAKVSGIVTAPASTPFYDVKAGYGFRGELEFGPEYENSKAGASLFYGYRIQNSSIVDVRRSDMGLSIFFTWRFGK